VLHKGTMKVEIYEDRLGLTIRMPPDEEAKSLLSFIHGSKPKVIKRFYSKKEKRVVEYLVDGSVAFDNMPLYYIDDKSGFIVTYPGMKQRLLDFYESMGDAVTITGDTLYVPPSTDDSIYEGLYPYQVEAARAMLESGPPGCMLSAATSAGKTHIIAALARAYAGHNGLIVTNRSAVAKRLYDDLVGLCPGNNIGIYVSDKKSKGDTMIITSATLKNFNPDNVKFLIYDECHGASGDARSQDIMRFRWAMKYGLSATIENKFTGMHNYLEAIFGKIVHTISDDFVEDLGRVSPLDVYAMKVNNGHTPEDGTQELTMEKHGIWYNRTRNKIIKDVCDLAPEDKQLLVFVRTNFHMDHLVELYLPEFQKYHAKLSTKEKKRMLEGFNSGEIKRIISTDSLAEGVDPKALFITINAHWGQSETSVLQKAGRNRRLAHGKDRGIVIDFMDSWHPRYASKAKSRISKYISRGYNVMEDTTPDKINFT